MDDLRRECGALSRSIAELKEKGNDFKVKPLKYRAAVDFKLRISKLILLSYSRDIVWWLHKLGPENLPQACPIPGNHLLLPPQCLPVLLQRDFPFSQYYCSQQLETLLTTLFPLDSDDVNWNICVVDGFDSYFLDNPKIQDYFVNVGFASVFMGYLTDDGLKRGQIFIESAINHRGLDVPWIAGLLNSFTQRSHRFMSTFRDFFVKLVSNDPETVDWKSQAFASLKGALEMASCDLTSSAASVWKTAFAKDSLKASIVFVKEFLVEVTKLWEDFPEFTRTPFLLRTSESSLSVELANLTPKECLDLMGNTWPSEIVGHSRECIVGNKVVKDPLQYTIADSEYTNVYLSWLDASVMIQIASSGRLRGMKPQLPGVEFSLDILQEGNDPLWAAFYYSQLRPILCQEKLPKFSDSLAKDLPPELVGWWKSLKKTATSQGVDPEKLIPDIEAPTAKTLFGLRMIQAKLEHTKTTRDYLRNRLVPHQLLVLQEKEIAKSIRVTSIVYARTFLLKFTPKVIVEALLKFIQCFIAHSIDEKRIENPRIQLKRSSEKEAASVVAIVAKKINVMLEQTERLQIISTTFKLQPSLRQIQLNEDKLKTALEFADELIFGYVIEWLNEKYGTLESLSGTSEYLYGDPREEIDRNGDPRRPEFNDFIVEAGPLGTVVNAMLRSFTLFIEDYRIGLDLIAFTHLYELLKVDLKVSEEDKLLLRHYWFGKFWDIQSADDESTECRANFARRLGFAREVIEKESTLPIPNDIKEAVTQLAIWFVSNE
jgi:hypothetical protein